MAKAKATPKLKAKTVVEMSPQMKALVGACEMLHKIRNGEQFRVVEFETRLIQYKRAAVAAHPGLEKDPYFGQFFLGYGA